MYCPVDGDEFREGITRCPEHDVALVDEPPEPAGPPASLPAFDERFGMRAALLVLVAGAIAYAGFGFAQDAGVAWAYIRDGNPPDLSWSEAFQSAGFSLALGAGLVLAGAVAYRAYQRLSGGPLPAATRQSEVEGAWANRITGRTAMRLLLGLVVLFSLVWMVAGIATSHEIGEYRAGPFAFSDAEPPSDTTIALFSLRDAAFVCGVGSFGIMAAAVMMRAHDVLISHDEREPADD